jgi:hypothetical protein
MTTPANDFDIFNQIARFQLRVCTRSAELDFVHGPKTGSQRYDHQFDTKTFENSLETCSALDTSTAIDIGQLCISFSNTDTYTFCHIGGAGEVMKAMNADPLIVAINII